MHVVIMAGGSGTRLWPKSRASKPKQFHNLTSDYTLLQETVQRLEPISPIENIYVIAGKTHRGSIREQVAHMPDENIVVEPMARNTAPAVAVMAALIHKKDPNAVMVVLPADHYMTKPDEFRRLVNKAVDVAGKSDAVITLGIKPTYPETGYGYIEMAGPYEDDATGELHHVKSFKEKPDAETAEEYVASWKFLWNSGMFIWSTKTILDLFKRLAPDIYEGAMRFADAFGTPQECEVLEEVYSAFPSISVDYAIMERADTVLVAPGDVGWSDVGSWAALHEVLSYGDSGNVVIGNHIGIDTHNCLVLGDHRLVATVGLDNLVIVDTGDVLLVCPKGRSQDVKHLIDKLKAEGRGEYL